MLLDANDSQLVLVDCQARLMPAIHDGPAVIRNLVRLGQLARLFEVPVWGTEHNAAKLGPNLAEVRALCHRTLAKMQFSAVGDGLLDWLRPPARPAGGNARSLPRHLQKPAAAAPARAPGQADRSEERRRHVHGAAVAACRWPRTLRL